MEDDCAGSMDTTGSSDLAYDDMAYDDMAYDDELYENTIDSSDKSSPMWCTKYDDSERYLSSSDDELDLLKYCTGNKRRRRRRSRPNYCKYRCLLAVGVRFFSWVAVPDVGQHGFILRTLLHQRRRWSAVEYCDFSPCMSPAVQPMRCADRL